MASTLLLPRRYAKAGASVLSAVLGLAAVGAVARAQNLLQNGSFESSSFTSTAAVTGGYGWAANSAPPGATDADHTAVVPSWTWAASPATPTNSTFLLNKTGGALLGTSGGAEDGSYYVSFGSGSANSGGSITQNFTAVAGQRYQVSLWVGRVGDMATLTASLAVKDNVANSNIATTSVGMTDVTSAHWKQVTLSFTATSSNLAFTFTDTTAAGAAPSADLLLDNVSIVPTLSAVPSGSVFNNVPEVGQYRVVYELNVPASAQYNFNPIAYAQDNSAAVTGSAFTRIAYALELNATTDSANTKWVWVSFDRPSNITAANKIGVPNAASGEFYHYPNGSSGDTTIANMNVYASSGAGVTTGTGISTGSIEFWSCDYNTGNQYNVPGADGSSYDFGDTPMMTLNYGSMQIHNYGAGQTVFALNDWGNAEHSTGIIDIGIGNQVGGSGHPDWTFAHNASGYVVKHLYVLVSQGITSATTATARVNNAFNYTITADNAPTSFSASGLPAGLTLNATTGVISGTPTTAGTYTVNLSATGAYTVTSTLALTVQQLQALTIYGTNVAPGTIDPNTDCSKDGDVTWLPAYALTPMHPWQSSYPIAGTTRWISRSADGQSAPTTSNSNPEILDFRIRFYAPTDLTSPSMSFILDPDNYGDIYLNGTKLNAQQIVGPSTTPYTIANANIQPGLNTIIVRLTDTGGWLGINYSVTVQGYASSAFQRLTAPPAVTNLTSSLANGTYGAGTLIPIQMTFTNAVTVTGAPTLALSDGRTATYASGSGTTTLTFNYTVQAGDNSADLDYGSTSALALNGGTIISSAADAQSANLTLPTPGASGSLGYNKSLVIDTTAPTLTVPGSLSTTATSASGATVTFSATATDNFGTPTISYSKNSGTTFPLGLTTVTVTATDAAGNTATKSFTVTVNQAVATITLTTPAYTYDGSPKPATATTSPAGLTVSFTYDGSGSSAPVNAGTHTVAASVYQAWIAGSTSGSFSIAPAAATVTIGNTTQSYDGTAKSVSVSTTPAGLATSVTYNGSTTAPAAVGSYAVVATVTNSNYAGSANATLAIKDTTPPVLSLPASITAEATSASGATVTFNASATDNVDGAVSVTLAPVSGSMFPLGTTTVTATATDHAGNTATGSFNVTVKDTTAPTLTVPANITAEATSIAGAVVNFAATATDATSTATITYSQNPGTTFPLGTTTVQVSASDPAGNTARGSFTVTVQDTIKPVLQLPADITATATSASGAVVNFSATATDAVGITMVQDGFENTAATYNLNTANYVSFGGSAQANGWTFNGYGGYLAGNGGGFGPMTQFDGHQCVFVQAYANSHSSIETAKSFTVFAGESYTLSFYQATRPGFGAPTYNVTLNSSSGQTELFRRSAAVGEGWVHYSVTFVPTTTETCTLAFNNLVMGDDATFFVDDVLLTGTKVAIPTTPASGGTFALGTTAVNASVVDFAGNSDSGSFNVTVNTATATLALTTPAYTYDGTAKPATATTTPAGLPVVFTYDSGPNAPVSAGTHAVVATVNLPWINGSTTGNVTIAKANAAIAVAPYSVTYDGTAHTATATVTGAQGESLAGIDLSATAHTAAGTYTNPWTFTDTTGNYNNASGQVTDAIGQASLTVTADAAAKVYGSADLALTYRITSGVLYGSDVLSGALVRATGENVGQYSILAGSVAANANYALSYVGANLTITPKPASVVATAATKVYGAADPALTGTLAGFLAADNVTATYSRTAGENVAGSPYSISAALVANPALSNYSITTTTAPFTITPASLAVQADSQTKVYGSADPALTYTVSGLQFSDTAAGVLTGALTRVAGENVKSGPYAIQQGSLGANSNYTLGFTGAALTITPATAAVDVKGYTGIYDGAAHGATGTATGVGGADLTALLDLGAKFTNVSGGTATWSFHDPAGNYVDATGTVGIALSKADPAITVTGYAVTYDGNAHVATGSAKGVNGESLAGLDLAATSHTAAGAFSDAWTFTDKTGNYNNGSGSVSDSIAKAKPTITVAAYDVTYDKQPHSATGSAKGVQGESLAGLDLTATTHTNAGSYTDTWTFTDVTGNYINGVASISDHIAKAPATIALAPLAQMYDGQPKPVTATTNPTGLTVDISYNGSATAPTLPGTYPVVATIDEPNYTGSLSTTLTVGVTALIRHGVTVAGDVDGSLQVLAGNDSTLNGNAGITGDLLVVGLPTVRANGKPTYAGVLDGTGAATPNNYNVTLNGTSLVRYIIRRTDPIALPTVDAPALPAGTRQVTLNKSTDTAGDWATVKDLTVNGNAGNVAVPAGTYGSVSVNGTSSLTLGTAGATTPTVYSFQSLKLNGTASLKIVGPVIVVVNGDVTANAAAGSTTHPEWLNLRLATGSLTVSANVAFAGYVTAPAGTVTINSNATVTGGVAADKLVVNANATLIQP